MVRDKTITVWIEDRLFTGDVSSEAAAGEGKCGKMAWLGHRGSNFCRGVTQHRLLRYDASRAMLTDEKGEITLQEKDRASWYHSHGGKAGEAIDTQDPAFQM